MADDIHIAGLVVHADPALAPVLQSHITMLPGARVHSCAPDGRAVVTLEAGSIERMLDYIEALRLVPGVRHVAMVYQHAEPAAAMDEELE